MVAMLYDDGENFVSIICSEKQGSDAGLQELYRPGVDQKHGSSFDLHRQSWNGEQGVLTMRKEGLQVTRFWTNSAIK